MTVEAESRVNLYIAEKFLSLIDGQCVVNPSHKKDMAENLNQNIVTPEEVGWKALGIGNINTWYGELDMTVRPFDSHLSATAIVGSEHPMEVDSDSSATAIVRCFHKILAKHRENFMPFNISQYC